MFHLSGQQRILGTAQSRARARTSRRPQANRPPRLETLEDRLAPSVSLTTVTSFPDNLTIGSNFSAGAPAVDAAGDIFDTTLAGGAQPQRQHL